MEIPQGLQVLENSNFVSNSINLDIYENNHLVLGTNIWIHFFHPLDVFQMLLILMFTYINKVTTSSLLHFMSMTYF
jgi:hypothetical protein